MSSADGAVRGHRLVSADEMASIDLGGTLAHIYQVKNTADLRDDDMKKAKPTATRSLYFRFLFYKNFVAHTMPLIVPEGKTNSVYLRAAIQYLTRITRALARSLAER